MSEDKLLRQDLTIYISDNSVTRKKLYHNHLLLYHFAYVSIENTIRKKYF